MPDGPNEEELRHRLFPFGETAFVEAKATPDFAQLHLELERKGVTRQLLWEEYCAEHPTNHYRYTQFCVLITSGKSACG